MESIESMISPKAAETCCVAAFEAPTASFTESFKPPAPSSVLEIPGRSF